MRAQGVLRHSLVGAAAVALLVGVVGCSGDPGTPGGGTSSAPPVVASGVTFSLSPGSLTNIAEYVGIDMGFFEKYGIVDSEIIPSNAGSTTLQLLAAGQLDFGAISIPATILAEQSSGVEMRVAVGMMKKYPASLVCNEDVNVSEDYPQGIKDLKGLTIASDSPTSSSTADLLVALRDNGVDPSEVNLVYISGGLAPTVAALTSKQVQCAMLWEPGQTQMGDSVKTVLDIAQDKAPDVVNNAWYNLLTVTKDYADKNPAVIEAVQRAMVEITEYLADPDNATEVAKAEAARYPDFSVEDLAKVIARLAPVQGAEITQEQYDACIQIFNIANQQNIDTPYEDLILPLPK